MQRQAADTVASLFATYAEFVKDGSLFRATVFQAEIEFIAFPVPANRVDGTTVLPNDVLLYVANSEELAGALPRPGDSITDEDDVTRTVVTAHQDCGGALWKMICRPVY